MNKNEQCLIDYLSHKTKNATRLLVEYLLAKNVNFSFKGMNPVCNIIDELEFSENFKYN